ncbi:MAG: PleD family two-component system response regulator [Rhodospirillales bacterium]|nr:PleD family two-component system response regulator [Rhodospirillales bacterium]
MTARVLVVDDVLPNVKLLEARLTSEYFHVVTAFGGQEALDKAFASPPDIVLLDVMMPQMDGFEACRRLKADPRTCHVPVIMVTALSASEDRVRGLEAGADDFLTKPVRDVALFARIRSLVRLKMLADEWRLRSSTSGRFGMADDSATIQGDISTKGARLLVVDDLPSLTRMLTQQLDADGVTIEVTANGADAVARAGSTPYDTIIINTLMRKVDALRLCAELRSGEMTRQTPLMTVIEDGDDARLARVLDLGVNDYLLTPVEPNELIARVRTQVRRRRYMEALRQNYERNMALALTDALTGLHNRRYMEAHLGNLAQRAIHSERTLALLMIDIDHFKKVNDTHGHPVGDEVLRAVAERLQNSVRPFDTVARWGGEEFMVVMPDADEKIGKVVAERLRSKIEQLPVATSQPQGGIQVTISIGVAASQPNGFDPATLIQAADAALYRAKEGGRNRVEAA